MASTKPFARTGNVGAAGELAFRAEVLARGHDVWLPVVDTGVDLVVADRRVQVKTAVERPKTGRGGAVSMGFTFKIDRLADETDVLVLVGISPGLTFRYWVVPVSVLPDPRPKTAWLCASADRANGGGKSPFEVVREYEGAWHLFRGAA